MMDNGVQVPEKMNKIIQIVDILFAGSDSMGIVDFQSRCKQSLYSNKELFEFFIMACYGVFPFISDQSLKKVEKNLEFRPQKEGFLMKEFTRVGLISSWNQHFCCVRDGYFYYYHKVLRLGDSPQDLPNFNHWETDIKQENVSRVVPLSLSIGKCMVKFLGTSGKCENCFEIITPHYRRKFSASTMEECKDWIKVLNKHCTSSPDLFPFESSFPLHQNISARWFVDGKDTFKAMVIYILLFIFFYIIYLLIIILLI